VEASPVLAPARTARPLELLRPKPAVDRAFEQLYKRHARDVYHYALALLTNPADAEDVTQTTFLNAYRAFQRGERPMRPRNWLIAIAHNVCRMRWRQAGHRPREVALDDAPEPVALEHDHPSIDEVLEALSHLTFNQRAAIVMRELEGRSCNEISETLGVSLSAVEALLFRARRNLQNHRRALGVLGTVPLPGSLASMLGLGGGGAAAVGGAIGADIALKTVVAFLAAGAIATGSVAVADSARHHATQPARSLPAAHTGRTHTTTVASPSHTTRPQARHGAQARSVTRARPRQISIRPGRTTEPPTSAGQPPASTGGVQTPPAVQPPAVAPPTLPNPPALPKPPPIPPLPVTITPPQLPPVPPLPLP
jgi:RNA polymerase sigma-70 factor (ECF subfamily)